MCILLWDIPYAIAAAEADKKFEENSREKVVIISNRIKCGHCEKQS